MGPREFFMRAPTGGPEAAVVFPPRLCYTDFVSLFAFFILNMSDRGDFVFTPVLNPASSSPLYTQLADQLRHAVEEGRLRAGERLPSKRALAAHLGVSVITVESAYGQLASEGYLDALPRRGFFVAAIPGLPAAPRRFPTPPYLPPADPPAPALAYDFTTSGVDTSQFPFSTWAKLMRGVLSSRDSQLLRPIHPQGVPELRRALAAALYQLRSIRADPEQIVVGAGSDYLLNLLVQLLGRDTGWAVEDPGYTKSGQILSACGAAPIPIPLDGQGMDVALLEASGARIAHLTPGHHFPLGITMPVSRRRELLAWAGRGEGRYLIEDDYDSDFRFDRRPVPALLSLDGSRVIYLSTFTRTMAPSLRLSYLVLPPALVERFRREFRFYASTVPTFEQYTMAAFLDGGHFERHIARMRHLYRLRQNALLSAAQEVLGMGPPCFFGTGAGLHLLFSPALPYSEGELCARAACHGVGVYPITPYYRKAAPPEQPTLVLGYAHLPAQAMSPAFRALKRAWGA